MLCEMCGTEMLPNMLNEYKTGKVVAVHVCPNCGLVTRDNSELNQEQIERQADDEMIADSWKHYLGIPDDLE